MALVLVALDRIYSACGPTVEFRTARDWFDAERRETSIIFDHRRCTPYLITENCNFRYTSGLSVRGRDSVFVCWRVPDALLTRLRIKDGTSNVLSDLEHFSQASCQVAQKKAHKDIYHRAESIKHERK
jgi:hypothetical protein